MQPQSVIIYRSRAEQELDNIIWNTDGTFGIIIVSLIIWTLVFVGLHSLYSKYSKKLNCNPYVIGIVAMPITYGIIKLINFLILI